MFVWSLAERDAASGKDNSRVFVRMVTNILLSLAAADGEINRAEAEYIADVAARLEAVCNASNVKASKRPLDPLDYVTTSEPSFIEKAPPRALGRARPARARPPAEGGAQDRRRDRGASPLAGGAARRAGRADRPGQRQGGSPLAGEPREGAQAAA